MRLLCRAWAPCNGTSTPPKLVVTLAPDHSTLQWHPPIAPHPPPQSWPLPSPSPTIAYYHGTLQWHPAMALQWHPAMAPSDGTSTPPKFVVTLPPHQSTLQWHPEMVPHPLPQSWSSPSPNHSTLQWHPTMAPSNGTTSTPLNLGVTLPTNHSTLQWHPAMAPRPLHPAIAPWCHVQSAKVVRRPPSYWK